MQRTPLRHGLVRTSDYRALLHDPLFSEIERYSDKFVAAHRKLLIPYKSRWVSDPLHQWSRQWEYPFVFAELVQGLPEGASAKILDAGSGITFFPYFIEHKFTNVQVYCADADTTLATLYESIDRHRGSAVKFLRTDIGDIPMPDASFDAIYCISVLEHTGNYSRIVEEFARLLRPRGRLILTFDISLDGNADIPIDKAEKLLATLSRTLRTSTDSTSAIGPLDGDVITTEFFRTFDPSMLPWKYPRLSGILASFARGRLPHFAMKRLAVSCHVFEKPV